MKTKKDYAKVMLVAILIVALGALTVFTISKKNNAIENLTSQNSQLNLTIGERDSLVNEMANTFNEIEENLSFVREKRNQLSIEQNEGTPDRAESMVADIKLMNTMLEESSIKIEELDKKLKASGIEIKGFKNRLAQLNEDVLAQNKSIDKLTKELSQKNEQIAEMDIELTKIESHVVILEKDVEAKNDSLEKTLQIVAKQDEDLNKTYVAAGTFDELAENGVLEKEGGFLGIGKSKALSDDINQAYFEEIDKRHLKYVPVFSKKAKLITQHPDSSFRFIEENNQITYVEIENPDEFWKYSKYAVIEKK